MLSATINLLKKVSTTLKANFFFNFPRLLKTLFSKTELLPHQKVLVTKPHNQYNYLKIYQL